MTIEYKDSKRIVASTESLLTSSDYTSSNFTTVGSTVAITNNSVVFSSTPTNADNGQYEQITALAESDSYTLDFKLNVSSHATFDNYYLALTNTSGAINSANQLGLQTQGGSYNRFTFSTRISGSSSETASSNGTVSTGTDYYCTLSSDGTTATFKAWTNSGRTGTASVTLTRPVSGLGTLNYIQHRSRNSGDSNTWSGTVSEVVLSRTPAKPTDVQDNSILVEKDTARRYWFSAGTAISFEDDFNTNDWDDAGTRFGVNTTTEKFDFDAVNDQTNDASVYDLGSGNVSDTAWVLRAELNFSTIDYGEDCFFYIVMSGSNQSAGEATNQKFIGTRLMEPDNATKRYDTVHGTVSNLDVLADNQYYTFLEDTPYFVEIIRTGSDTFTVEIFTVSFGGTSLGKISTSGISGVTGLQFIKFANRMSGGGSGQFTGTIDNVEFYNGITSAPTTATWTMEPTWRDDFSSDKGWVSANSTYSSVNTSTEKIDFDFDAGDGNADKQIYYDLTSVDTNWVLRFKLNWSALTSANNAYMYVGLTDNVGGTGTTQNGFELRFINAPAAGSQYVDFGVNQINNTLPYNLGTSASTSNMVYTTSKDYYVEMKKDGTSLTATVFENSDFTGMWQTATETITTTITPSLRYLHFWNSMSANTGAWTGTIDDVEFYNGVNSVN